MHPGVDGHDGPVKRHSGQQRFDRGNFVRLFFTGALPQGQAIFRGMRRDLMQGSPTPIGAGRSPRGFTVDGDDSPFYRWANFSHPGFEALLQLHWRQDFEDAPNGVVTGNAIAQAQITPKPGFALTSSVLDVALAVRPGHHGA